MNECLLNCSTNRPQVTPVCGLISPVCEHCHRRIDAFDENAPPKVIEYVIKTDLDPEPLDYDPLNVGDMSDPMGDDGEFNEGMNFL